MNDEVRAPTVNEIAARRKAVFELIARFAFHSVVVTRLAGGGFRLEGPSVSIDVPTLAAADEILEAMGG